MTSTFTAAEIKALLVADLSACEALLELLEQERDALESRDQQRLETIIRAKAEHLGHLEQSAQVRSRWAKSLNAAAQPEQVWQTVIADQAPEIVDLWSRLKAQVVACRTENEINGKVLARNQKTFNRILSILRGQTPATNLYTNKGARNSSSAGHRLGEA